jgi:hypothetical protein
MTDATLLLTSSQKEIARSNLYCSFIANGVHKPHGTTENGPGPAVPCLKDYLESSRVSAGEHRSSESIGASTRPLRRKSHVKSRRGCYNCKKRSIKVGLILTDQNTKPNL